MSGVRRLARDSRLPAGSLLARLHIPTPGTSTVAAQERPFVGSPWASASVVLVAVIAAIWSTQGDAYLQTLIGLAGAYLVAALGYNVVLGNAGQFAFCQNAFLAIGAYGYAVCQPHVGALVAAVAGVAAAGVAGTVIGVAIIRTREIYLALLTLAFSQAALLAIGLWPPTMGDNGIGVVFGGSNPSLVAIFLAAVAVLLVQRLLRSRTGRAFALIRADEQMAASMGVNVPLTRVLAFTFSSLLGGLGGILLAGILTFITPTNFTLDLTLLLLTMIVIGGAGSVWGTVVGVAIMVVIGQLLPQAGGAGSYINAGLLFLILAVRPGGLRSLVSLSTGGRHG